MRENATVGKKTGGNGWSKGVRGFVVLEVPVAILIIGLLAGMTLPVWGNLMARQELDLAARRLASDIRWLQQLSINGSGDVLPQLELTEWGYMITQGTKSMKSVKFPLTVRGYSLRMVFGINGTLAQPYSRGLTLFLYSRRITDRFRKVVIDAPGRIRVE